LYNIILLIDRSGSLNRIKHQIIKNINKFILKIKKLNNSKLTLILFDDDYEIIYKKVPIKEVGLINDKIYTCIGYTGLYDALGKTLNCDITYSENENILITLCEGSDNSSIEFTSRDILNKLCFRDLNTIYFSINLENEELPRKLGFKHRFKFNDENIDILLELI